jgi:hypothetical protein
MSLICSSNTGMKSALAASFSRSRKLQEDAVKRRDAVNALKRGAARRFGMPRQSRMRRPVRDTSGFSHATSASPAGPLRNRCRPANVAGPSLSSAHPA